MNNWRAKARPREKTREWEEEVPRILAEKLISLTCSLSPGPVRGRRSRAVLVVGVTSEDERMMLMSDIGVVRVTCTGCPGGFDREMCSGRGRGERDHRRIAVINLVELHTKWRQMFAWEWEMFAM